MCAAEPPLRLPIRALAFAAQKHRDHRRKDSQQTPYVNHLIAVVEVLVEHGVDDPAVLAAAALHDTVEDTDTTLDELRAAFGDEIAAVVAAVTDDKKLVKAERKRLQVEHAPQLAPRARLVKLADKICNLRDVADQPPAGWPLARRQEYFDWAKAVVDGLRGTHAALEAAFDAAYARRPVA